MAESLTGAIKEILAANTSILSAKEEALTASRTAALSAAAAKTDKQSADQSVIRADQAAAMANQSATRADQAAAIAQSANNAVSRISIEISGEVAKAEAAKTAINNAVDTAETFANEIRSAGFVFDLAYARAISALYAAAASNLYIEAMFWRSVEQLYTHEAEIYAIQSAQSALESGEARDEARGYRDESKEYRDDAECFMIRTRAYYDATKIVANRAAMLSFMGAMNA